MAGNTGHQIEIFPAVIPAGLRKMRHPIYATIFIFLSKCNNEHDIISDSDSKILVKLVKLNERYCKGKSGILFRAML